MPANRAVKLPSGMDEKDAVSGFLMGMTALSLTKEAYEVKKGDTVLLHAAAGGMGLILCQVLKEIGAYTIGTAGSAEKCKLAEEYGADVTNQLYREQAVARQSQGVDEWGGRQCRLRQRW